MHACDTQTVSGTGEFGVFEGTASANGDIGMQGEPSVKLASSKLQKSDCFFQVVGSLFSGRVVYQRWQAKGKLQLPLES